MKYIALIEIPKTDMVIIVRPNISTHNSTGGVTDCSKNICVTRDNGMPIDNITDNIPGLINLEITTKMKVIPDAIMQWASDKILSIVFSGTKISSNRREVIREDIVPNAKY